VALAPEVVVQAVKLNLIAPADMIRYLTDPEPERRMNVHPPATPQDPDAPGLNWSASRRVRYSIAACAGRLHRRAATATAAPAVGAPHRPTNAVTESAAIAKGNEMTVSLIGQVADK